MNPLLIVADEKQRAPHRKFSAREFRRVISLTKPHRKTLIAGLLVTVCFAGLHTAGIGAAFPIFKVLLEEEGLHGWAARTVAGARLEAELAPLAEPDFVRIVRLKKDSPLRAAGAVEYDLLVSPDGAPIRSLLDQIARSQVAVDAAVGRSLGELTTVTVSPKPLETSMRLLQWATSLLPPDSQETKLRTLGIILLVVVLIVVTANALRFTGEALVASAVLHAMMDLRDQLYDRILRLPMTFFSGTDTSDLVSRFVQDIQEVQRGLVTLFGKAMREPMRAVFLVGLALIIDWRVTLTLIIVVPLAAIVFLAVGRKAKKANFRLLQAYGSMIAALTASLQNLRVVKAYTAEDHERARLDVVDRRMLKQQLRLARLDAFLSPMLETLGVLAGSLLTLWLAGLVIGGTLSISDFAALGVVLSMIFDPLRKLSDVYVRIQRSTAGSERIFAVLDTPIELEDARDAVELKPLQRGLEYADVSFTYPGATSPAIDNVNLTIKCGETLAIVGPNGSGKTTLACMLPRLFDPARGKILYDGIDVRRARLQALRRQIGWVSQDAIVFAATPIENIAYGDPAPDRERAVQAAVRAYADEFIRAIPGGYEAVLGERGTTLSGGQRQRLAIARAIYRDPPILIFDEATSQIDSESELKIQRALRDLSRDRTTIIIAHRLSTIQFADRIVVMDAGQVIDSGSHRELFERCPLYQTLCETQFMPAPA